MTINTEYAIGERFFTIESAGIVERKIERIYTDTYFRSKSNKAETTIQYESFIVDNASSRRKTESENMFRTKQEAGDHWMKKQGLKGSK